MQVKLILSTLRRIDWILVGSTLFLVLVGLQAIYSLSLGESGLTRFDVQLIAFGVGLIVFIVFAVLDYRRLGSASWLLYIISLVLLLGVLFFGTTFSGTTGWFVVGGFSFQPVEIVKVLAVIILSFHLSQRASVPKAHLWLESLGLLAPFIILLALQPDFGPAILLLSIWFVLNAVRGLRLKGWLTVAGIAILVMLVAWFVVLNDTQKLRLTTFVNPSIDRQGAGFQIQQSIIAVGAGGLTGRGLGEGYQSQLAFLPAAETDFIFASILEERGLIGFILILAAFSIFFWRLWLILRRSPDAFTQYLSFGLGLLFLIQVLLNISMNLGLAPVVGLPLPFLSYGGSALTAELVALGVLMSVVIRQKHG